MSPFFTDEGNDLRRLQRVIKVTRAAGGAGPDVDHGGAGLLTR